MDLSDTAGGVAQCVGSLCSTLSQAEELSISLLAGGFAKVQEDIQLERVAQLRMNPRSFSNGYQQLAQLHLERPIDVIHDHGQWLPFNLCATRFASRFQIPRIVSPHGMLTVAARSHRRLKKQIAWRLYAKRCLDQASLIHVTSDQELAQVRALIEQQTVVIPNGFNPPINLSELLDKPREKIVAFLGRLHPIKGVPELLSAWQKCRPEGWTLCIAGPDEVGLFVGREIPPGVKLLGALNSVEKFRFLAGASVLILPSHSENFGIVVPEALCVGTPVIASHGTPWKCLAKENMGWWVELTEEALVDVLKTATECPADQLKAMGLRGSMYVRDRFAWKNIATQFSHVYRDLAAKSRDAA